MVRRIVVVLSSFFVAFLVFFTSAMKASSVAKPIFTPKPTQPIQITSFNYGMVAPGSPLWSFKAISDRLGIETTFDSNKKFDLILDASSNRMELSRMLFNLDRLDAGYSTLTKSEKYLETASKMEERRREDGEDTSKLLAKLRNTSLNNQETINKILSEAPENIRPEIIRTGDTSRRIYINSSKLLTAK